tara:strand:+ start:625 stop:825 length:201 start_codon:yes stop_codon:yes gene_type:complete
MRKAAVISLLVAGTLIIRGGLAAFAIVFAVFLEFAAIRGKKFIVYWMSSRIRFAGRLPFTANCGNR